MRDQLPCQRGRGGKVGRPREDHKPTGVEPVEFREDAAGRFVRGGLVDRRGLRAGRNAEVAQRLEPAGHQNQRRVLIVADQQPDIGLPHRQSVTGLQERHEREAEVILLGVPIHRQQVRAVGVQAAGSQVRKLRAQEPGRVAQEPNGAGLRCRPVRERRPVHARYAAGGGQHFRARLSRQKRGVRLLNAAPPRRGVGTQRHARREECRRRRHEDPVLAMRHDRVLVVRGRPSAAVLRSVYPAVAALGPRRSFKARPTCRPRRLSSRRTNQTGTRRCRRHPRRSRRPSRPAGRWRTTGSGR